MRELARGLLMNQFEYRKSGIFLGNVARLFQYQIQKQTVHYLRRSRFQPVAVEKVAVKLELARLYSSFRLRCPISLLFR